MSKSSLPIAIVLVLLLGPPSLARTPVLSESFDGPKTWNLSGEAEVVCSSSSSDCELKLAPTRASQKAPPGTASATRMFPTPVSPEGYLSWTFVGATEAGWTDADLRLDMVDGTVVLVSHTEDRRNGSTGEYYGNNGVSLQVGSARFADFASWTPGEPQRLTLFLSPAGVSLGIAPADGSRPMIMSPSARLPQTAIAATTVTFQANSFGDLPGGQAAAYWFDDLDMGVQ